MENLHDEAGCKEPGDLFSDRASLPLGEATQGLLHRLCIRSHMKFVLGVLPRNTRHVLGGACKDVSILTEEVDELAFLFGAEASPDGDALLWVGTVEWDLLGLFSRLERALAGRLGRRRRNHRLLGSLGHEPVDLPLLGNHQGVGEAAAILGTLEQLLVVANNS